MRQDEEPFLPHREGFRLVTENKQEIDRRVGARRAHERTERSRRDEPLKILC